MRNQTCNSGDPMLRCENCLKGKGTMAEIVTLHGVKPAEIFQSRLEHADEIHAVETSILWKDERQRRATLAYEDLNFWDT